MMEWSVVLREVEEAAGVFGGDVAAKIGRKLIEQENGGLPALRAGHGAGGTVMLIGADDEASRKIGKKFEPVGSSFAIGEDGRIFAEEERVDFDFHVEIGMGLQEATAKIGSAKADAVPASVSPEDFGARIVSEKAFEGGEIFLKLSWIGRGRDAERKGHVLRDDVEVKIDGDIVLRGDVGEEKEERMAGGRGFVNLAGRERKMLGTHFAEAESAFAKNFLGARFEDLLDAGAGVLGANGSLEHEIQAAAAGFEGEFAGMHFQNGDEGFVIEVSRIAGSKRDGHEDERGGVFAARCVKGGCDFGSGIGDNFGIEVDVRVNVGDG